jgi:hypothetical protein
VRFSDARSWLILPPLSRYRSIASHCRGAPGGGNAQQRALLRAGHDQADDDLVTVAEDVLYVGVQIGDRRHDAGRYPGYRGAAGEVADGAAWNCASPVRATRCHFLMGISFGCCSLR